MIDLTRTKTTLSDLLREPRRFAVVIAAGAAVITNLLIGVAWAWQADVARSEHIQALGQASAAQLATLSVEPLIAVDAIRLGVLTTRLASLPTIRLAAIHTLDDRVVALAGSETRDGGHEFKAPIEFENDTAGYARIVLDDDAISGGLSLGPVVALMAVVSIMACAFLGHLLAVTYANTGTEQSVESEAPKTVRRTYLLVVNLFNLNRVPIAERASILARCRERLDRLASRAHARVMELPGTGWLVVFETDVAAADRAFRVVLHALLGAEVLDELNADNHTGARLELVFRFGLHDMEAPGSDTELKRSDELADAVVLSAVAPDGCVAVSESTFERVLRPERLIADELTNPVLSSLATTRTDACVVISTTADTYRHALDRELHEFHEATTSSPSTF